MWQPIESFPADAFFDVVLLTDGEIIYVADLVETNCDVTGAHYVFWKIERNWLETGRAPNFKATHWMVPDKLPRP